MTEKVPDSILQDIRIQLILMPLLLCSAALLSSCALFNTEPFVDTTTNSAGEKILEDSPRRWNDWVEIVSSQIQAEAAGLNAPGFDCWDEKWTTQLRAIRTSQENAQRYIRYIVDGREKLELPELSEIP